MKETMDPQSKDNMSKGPRKGKKTITTTGTQPLPSYKPVEDNQLKEIKLNIERSNNPERILVTPA